MVKHLRRLQASVNRLFFLRTGSWTAVIGWALTVTYLSSLSGADVAGLNAFELSDKLLHFVAFAIGGIVLALALRLTTAWSARTILLVAVLAIALFGAVDEWHQQFRPGRSGTDIYDWIADVLGAIAGAWALLSLHARYQRKTCPAPAGA